jgi:hypothetical protein
MSYKILESWNNRSKKTTKNGYILVKVPEHPKNHNGWVLEHVLVAERMLRRVIVCGESVHHINEIKHDNRQINLFVCYRAEHDKAHGMNAVYSKKLHPSWICRTCSVCGRIFWGNKRIVKRKQRCSASCRPILGV